MIQAIHRASSLALKAEPNCFSRIRKLPFSNLSVDQNFVSSVHQVRFCKPNNRALPNKPPILSTTRSCSYQRTMCKANAEVEGSVDVTQAREVLPTNVKPVHYDLTLEPNFSNFSYEGTVVIE